MKRFEQIMWNSKIVDRVTGKEYTEEEFYNGEVLDLMNDMNDRADRNAEEYSDLKKVMNKFGIQSAEKLEKILFEKGVW